MNRFERIISGAILTLLVAATVLILPGCGTGHSPVASTDIQPQIIEADGRSLLSFGAAGAQRAAKIATIPTEGVTVSDLFGLTGGTIQVKDDNGNGPKDDLRVTFTVPDNALNLPTNITMTVYGNTLEDLVVEFQPSGLVFLQDAELDLRFGTDLVSTPFNQIVVWHEYSDGTVVPATFSKYNSGNIIRLKIDIPGFSKYSSGGGV